VSRPNAKIAELSELLAALCDGELSTAEWERLESLLIGDAEAQEFYSRYIALDVDLAWHSTSPVVRRGTIPAQGNLLAEPTQAGTTEFSGESVSKPVGLVSSESKAASMPWMFDIPAKPRPKVVIEPSPPRPIPWYSVNSPIGLPLISYSLGAIIMLIAIGIGAVVHITHSYEIAAGKTATSEEVFGSGGGSDGLSGALATAEKVEPKKQEEAPFVGHISGMADCRWADPALKPITPRIRQGTKFALESGLMEITYTTGAKVILQGPCTYEVESPHGGYLALGKLTARVKPPKFNSSIPAKRSRQAFQTRKLSLEKSLFAVRTPTAIITDLGTEFGVEVVSDSSYILVFQGSVNVAPSEGEPSSQSKTIAAGHEAYVAKEGQKVKVFVKPSELSSNAGKQFVRHLLSYYTRTVLADKPVFYWTFNEESGPAYEQVRRWSWQALVPYGGATRCNHEEIGSSLVLGRAADFTKASGGFCSHYLQHQPRKLPGAWAVEFWVQVPTTAIEHRSGQYILNMRSGIYVPPPYGENKPGIIFNWPENLIKNEVQLYHAGKATHGGPVLEDDCWHHIILVFYGNGTDLGVAPRVDAVFDGQVQTLDRAGFSASFNLDGPLWVGAAGQDLAWPFRGRLDELAFYDLSGLTVAEIEARVVEMARSHVAAAQTENNFLPPDDNSLTTQSRKETP